MANILIENLRRVADKGNLWRLVDYKVQVIYGGNI